MLFAPPSHRATLLFLVLFCVLIPGCKDKLTQENMDKIKLGMSEDEVVAMLGKGRTASSVSDVSSDLPGSLSGQVQNLLNSGGECRKWSSGRTILVVRFDNGKVAGTFSYSRSK
jgi:hypothetical protein